VSFEYVIKPQDSKGSCTTAAATHFEAAHCAAAGSHWMCRTGRHTSTTHIYAQVLREEQRRDVHELKRRNAHNSCTCAYFDPELLTIAAFVARCVAASPITYARSAPTPKQTHQHRCQRHKHTNTAVSDIAVSNVNASYDQTTQRGRRKLPCPSAPHWREKPLSGTRFQHRAGPTHLLLQNHTCLHT